MELIWSNLGAFFVGAGVTLRISLTSVCFGLIIGLVFGLMRISKNRIIRFLAGIYVEVIRGTPLLVQLLYIYYALPQVGIIVPKYVAATIAISINSGAYVAEIVRAGIQSIDKGQMEAARSLGMSYPAAMRYIILPQAFRRIIPPLVNEFITLIKDSSLISVLGIAELTRVAEQIMSRTFNVFVPFTATAVIYFIMTFTLSQLMAYLERRWQIRD
ncbi:MAG: amino acid ABC transporter permease [Dethiobacteria bacterium]|jgi:polar amino acid transport system permease protein|nr:amino acid ABC transporter permease [Bacillota bacterium]HOP69808.1 amino acid ABC transporter permease [Bacillota bacterium]HPT34028.1 amino acid ABC transporter permease [Bacillota bacterium]HPZ64888.1 amino acid ABC transporter permease [Bacillota bacterium]HQD06030.1 amino acid ABC transporter permease [Bacillota bacterium]